MPQPLSRVRAISSSGWGAGSLAQHPALALLVSEIIGCWSDSEVMQARLFVHFVGAKARLELLPFLARPSPEARKEVLRAVAAEALKDQPEDLALFASVLRSTSAVRSRRNDLAHGIWGTSDELPDALLWCNQEDALYSEMSVRKYIGSLEAGRPSPNSDFISREWAKNVFVYRLRDLECDLEDARGANNALYLLLGWLTSRDTRLRANLLQVPLMSRGKNGEED